MARAKKKEQTLRDSSDKELNTLVSDTRRELFDLKARIAKKDKEVKSHEVRQARKNIARALTILRERTLTPPQRKKAS